MASRYENLPKKRRRQLARQDFLYALKRFVRMLVKVAAVSALAVGVIATGMRLGASRSAPITLHWSITLHGLPKGTVTPTASLTASDSLPVITGPLLVTGKAGRTVTVQYYCANGASPFWGVGTDGDGSSIAGITPYSNGQYTIPISSEESDWVWISNIPDGPGNTGCASIQVHIVAKGKHHKR